MSDGPAPAAGTEIKEASRERTGAQDENGTLGVVHLKCLWSRMMTNRQGKTAAEEGKDWLFDQICFRV